MEEKLEHVISDIMSDYKINKEEAKGVVVTLFDAYVHGINLEVPKKNLDEKYKH